MRPACPERQTADVMSGNARYIKGCEVQAAAGPHHNFAGKDATSRNHFWCDGLQLRKRSSDGIP
ncbi:hypothetical protein ACFC25_08740 [Pseudarthrobacter sp. NPDC055928]|uniref:hypothetical protein n=1 Tax=Pseudarthrobacter sp. NPDC055928 TaxID=3345661 RepID=UPI0035D75FEF